jgi:hypothetical protein
MEEEEEEEDEEEEEEEGQEVEYPMAWWHVLIGPVTQKLKKGPLKPRSLKLMWAT